MQHALDEHGEAVDFSRRRALNLPEAARFDGILKTPKDGNLGAALNAAMDAIEDAFPPLAGQLPKDYARFDGGVLEDMMKMFDSEGLRKASGDVFGRISRYHSRQVLSFPRILRPCMATSAWPWSVRGRSAIDGGFALVATTCH